MTLPAANTEAKLIAYILSDNAAYLAKCDQDSITRDMFLSRFGWAFAQISARFKEGNQTDITTLKDIAVLAGESCPMKLDDFDEILQIDLMTTPTESDWSSSVEILRERKVAHVLETASKRTGDPIANTQSAIAEAIEIAKPNALTESAAEVAEQWRKDWEHTYETGIHNGMGTGYEYFDQFHTGMKPKALWCAGAKPGTGKTAMMLEVAMHVAANYGRVIFVSYEMGNDELMSRMVANAGNVSMTYTANGSRVKGIALDHDREATRAGIMKGIDRVSKLPILLRDNSQDIDRLCAYVRRECELRGDVKLVCVDYLQRIPSGERKEGRVIELDRTSRALKQLASDTRTTIFTACQLNKDGLPRESEGIWNDADVLLLLGDEGFNVRKMRNGPAGRDFAYKLDGRTQTFDFDATAQTDMNGLKS